MKRYMKIYEYDHFHKDYEDRRNNLFLTVLNEDVGLWIHENLSGSYDITLDDYYESDECSYIFIEFETNEDAMAFKLMWL